MAEFVEISLKDLPDFLKNSQLYEHLMKDEIENESLSIPTNNYKGDLTINSFKDFIILMETFKYWNISEVPYIIYEFVDDNKTLFYDKIDRLLTKFPSLKFIREIEIIIKYQNVPDRAVQCQFFDLLKYCNQKKVGGVKKYEFTNDTINIAAIRGNLTILKFLHDSGCSIDITTRNYSIHGGNIECLKYIENASNIALDTDACNIAALFGHLHILKYIIEENNVEYNIETVKNTIIKGSLECLKYFIEKGIELNNELSDEASLNGHLECLQYLIEHKCSWNDNTTYNASLYGHYDCLKYALENDCPRSHFICNNSAEKGHYECLKLAFENGCCWNETTCALATLNGHFDCLKFAHENGCPWDGYTLQFARSLEKEDLLNYVIENKCHEELINSDYIFEEIKVKTSNEILDSTNVV